MRFKTTCTSSEILYRLSITLRPQLRSPGTVTRKGVWLKYSNAMVYINVTSLKLFPNVLLTLNTPREAAIL